MELHDRLAELLAFGGPGDGLVEQALHGADAAGGDVDALLDEPGVLPSVALPNLSGASEHGRLWHHAVKLIRRVSIGKHVRKRWVVDDLDARERKINEKQRG